MYSSFANTSSNTTKDKKCIEKLERKFCEERLCFQVASVVKFNKCNKKCWYGTNNPRIGNLVDKSDPPLTTYEIVL